MFDMIRVFFLCSKNKKSPFVADKNHIHHKFIRLGYSHLKSTLIIIAYNSFTIALVFYFKNLDIHLLIGMLLGLGIVFNIIPDILLRRKGS
jgi:UDP-GlcNAc:undecaprenyl-phosphate/decaprenyl-phosphate GlcNAc-1-phosphate transferase